MRRIVLSIILLLHNSTDGKVKGTYNMGCECGKQEIDLHAEQDCERSAILEDFHNAT